MHYNTVGLKSNYEIYIMQLQKNYITAKLMYKFIYLYMNPLFLELFGVQLGPPIEDGDNRIRRFTGQMLIVIIQDHHSIDSK